MFTKGEFDAAYNNPWVHEKEKSAPFNQEFFLIFNVAIGGTNSYFPDGQCGKPWTNTSPRAPNEFYDNKEKWFESWNYPATHDSAMQIDYVKVWGPDVTEDELWLM